MSDVEQMISDCETRESRLSEWEREFVSSLRERVDAGLSLTSKQEETLETVWNNATKKG